MHSKGCTCCAIFVIFLVLNVYVAVEASADPLPREPLEFRMFPDPLDEATKSFSRGPSYFTYPDAACQLEKVVGICSGRLPRFFFNSSSESCQLFSYGGCGGNENNYETFEICQQKCEMSTTLDWPNNFRLGQSGEPSGESGEASGESGSGSGDDIKVEKQETKEVLCSLPKIEGRCRSAIPRYFFNSATSKCEEFVYGGCQGNRNNFRNLATCLQTCNGILIDNREEVLSDLPSDTVTSTPQERVTEKVSNNRHLDSRDYRERDEDRPTLAMRSLRNSVYDSIEVCNHDKDAGRCMGYMPRYFFNSTSLQCEQFVYGGCGGNMNNFKNLDQCEIKCAVSVQPRVKLLTPNKKPFNSLAPYEKLLASTSSDSSAPENLDSLGLILLQNRTQLIASILELEAPEARDNVEILFQNDENELLRFLLQLIRDSADDQSADAFEDSKILKTLLHLDNINLLKITLEDLADRDLGFPELCEILRSDWHKLLRLYFEEMRMTGNSEDPAYSTVVQSLDFSRKDLLKVIFDDFIDLQGIGYATERMQLLWDKNDDFLLRIRLQILQDSPTLEDQTRDFLRHALLQPPDEIIRVLVQQIEVDTPRNEFVQELLLKDRNQLLRVLLKRVEEQRTAEAPANGPPQDEILK